MHVYILQVLIFSKQNLNLFKINNENYKWSLRKEANLKSVCYDSSFLNHFSSNLYNEKQLFNKLTKTIKRTTFLILKKISFYLQKVIIASTNV